MGVAAPPGLYACGRRVGGGRGCGDADACPFWVSVPPSIGREREWLGKMTVAAKLVGCAKEMVGGLCVGGTRRIWHGATNSKEMVWFVLVEFGLNSNAKVFELEVYSACYNEPANNFKILIVVPVKAI